MQQHSISAKYESGMHFSTDVDTFSIDTDSQEEDKLPVGPGPKKLMLVSLAGCTGIDVVSILQKMKVPFNKFSIQVQATLGQNHPKTYTEVRVHYFIQVDATHHEKVHRAVQLSEEKYCGVMAMFRSFAKVELSIHFL
ncbi:MAG: OsmC family protein [Ferruginibacter sp.]|nr:OsmC family protein [Ferruginibacter sp.]